MATPASSLHISHQDSNSDCWKPIFNHVFNPHGSHLQEASSTTMLDSQIPIQTLAKQYWAWAVLRWETAWEFMELLAWIWILVLLRDEKTVSSLLPLRIGEAPLSISGRASLSCPTNTRVAKKLLIPHFFAQMFGRDLKLDTWVKTIRKSFSRNGTPAFF